jgi:hypothetical protein
MLGAPHTAHGLDGAGRSASTDFLAISKISGEIIDSPIGFFFIVDFTIEQIGTNSGTLDDRFVTIRAPPIHKTHQEVRLVL